MSLRGLIILVAIIVLGVGVAQASLGRVALEKAGLYEQPIDYTSLAFLNPQFMPEKLTARQTTVNIAFVIQNTGGTSHDYQWSVLLVQGHSTRHLAAGSVHVAVGKGTEITQSARISCSRGQITIVASLARPAEYIDARMACTSSGR